jgi:hypothetical protein
MVELQPSKLVMRVRFPSPAPRIFYLIDKFRFTVHPIAAYRSAWQHFSVLYCLRRNFKQFMHVRRTGLEPDLSTQNADLLGWSCGLDSPSPAPQGRHLIDAFPSRRPTDCRQVPSTGRQRPPDPVSSLFKQDFRTQLSWREGPAGDLLFYPIPKARGPTTVYAERRTREKAMRYRGGPWTRTDRSLTWRSGMLPDL